MRLLTVFSHPIRHGYVGAVVDSFHQPFVEAGHSVDLLDLHREGFDPRFTEADHAHVAGAPTPPEVLRMQRRVEAADRLALVFPVYWWSMPALMKGWIERVFTGQWAHHPDDDAVGGLAPMPTLLLGVGGSTSSNYDRYGYQDAMRTQIDVGIFSYCRLDDVESHFIFEIDGSQRAEERQSGLREARRLGGAFSAPDRDPRRAREDHFRWLAERTRDRP